MKRTYGNLRLDGAHWIMDEIGPYAAMQLKRQFPKIPSGTAGPFAFSNRPDIAEDLRWFMARFPMLMKRQDAAALIAASDLHRRRVAEVEEICRPDWKPRSTEGLGFRRGVKLHDHQARNIEIAARFGRLLIMDELGAGKTHSGMGCILAAKTLPAAIIVQRHLMKQWARQITKFTTLTVHEIRRTTPYTLPQADIYLFSYTQIAGWVDVVAQAPFRGVVFDEIQDIRAGEKTAKGKAARVFTAGADLRVGMSIGPDSRIEAVGGLCGNGWCGSIEDLWNVVSHLGAATDANGYEVIDLSGSDIKTRGWIEAKGWGWKPIKKMIRHVCDKPVLRALVRGRELIATDDHSIFVAGQEGMKTKTTSLISAGDVLISDNGRNWGAATEQPLLPLEVVRKIDRCQAVVSLHGVTRHDLGLAAWQWQNCMREQTYGDRIPIDVYIKNAGRLPTATGFYAGRGRAPYVPSEIMLSEMAYLLGFFIGDGWVSERQRICFAVEDARVDEFCAYAKDRFHGANITTRKMKGRSFEVRITHRLMAEIFYHIFGGAKCHEKRIPAAWIMSWPEHARRELLAGLVDSDGRRDQRERNRSSARYSTVSKHLASDLMVLLTSLGVIGSHYVRNPTQGGVVNGRVIEGKRPAHTVCWSWNAEVGLERGRKGNRHRYEWTNGVTKESVVRSIEIADQPEYVYDFEMDGHPSFSANGILVHNSATPIYNYGDESWFIMDILEPGCLGTWVEFVTEWCSYRGKDKWIVNDPSALGSYLIDRHLVTRHKTEKRPVNQIVVEVDFDEEVEAKELNFAAALAQRVLHGSFTERGQASRELDMMARRITGLAKAASVAAYVRILVESGEPVILAGWHREVYAKWMELLGDLGPMLYTGTESASQKDKVAKAFISGACRLLIISLRSGAGLDGLQERGRFVVFGELDWTNACHSQLIGRLDRPGQKHEVTAIFCVTDGGSDPAIQGVLGLKDSQMRGITDPLAGTVTVHSDVDRFREIAKMYLAKAAAA